ncbi:Exostosin family protein isoform 1 [Tripterygium wilfordii]|uniref:Exostosin family protein isoform 1 n=1 Tax=Tripterygium wilfordii TaxID=458696 RepID=A0A7J7CCJ2_TRIWF|nr:probable arabinosyltransferase ARAD1 isoform X1 [Tripterygium wilfordii]KAF5731655.1 Exostosin family protein isoform 1 [Tripterygium wilfordii]
MTHSTHLSTLQLHSRSVEQDLSDSPIDHHAPGMYGKAIIISLILVLFLSISYSVYIGTVGLRPSFFPLLPSASNVSPLCSTGPPLRVYMYDLPRRFHVGMLEPRHSRDAHNDTEPVTAENLPPWRYNSGVGRQHSAEYWLMASLLYDGGDGKEEGREAVRVLDPEMAEAFYVPFFSSLSFNIHGVKMADPEAEIDHQLQVDLVEFLQKSKYWQRSGGRDHVIPMQQPNAFRFMREQVNTSILIVADFGRYPKTLANLRKDVVAPYVHILDSFTDDDPLDPFESRTMLLFFQGNTVRKSEGKIRAKLAKALSGYDDIHYEHSTASVETVNMSRQGMRSSKFCLHPAGDTPSSCRLFDAIASHCIPVIVSDHIELPFEDEIDYTQFSIFFSVKEAVEPGYMVDQLRRFPKKRWVEMWRQLKSISHHYEFQYPPRKEDGVNMIWRQVKRKLPGVQLASHRSQRLQVPDPWLERR